MRGAYPVNVEDVDVIRAQFLERLLDRNMHRLHAVSNVHLLLDVVRPLLEISGILTARDIIQL